MLAVLCGCGDDTAVDADAAPDDGAVDARLDGGALEAGGDAIVGADGMIDDAATGDAATEDAAIEDATLGDAIVEPGTDSDGDGLPDTWEGAAGDTSLLDPARGDTDGNGTSDANEDPDGDGLTNVEELAAARIAHVPDGNPHPFRLDLLIELDAMDGKLLDDAAIVTAAGAYGDLPLDGRAGQRGVGLFVYRDEMSIAVEAFDGSFDQRYDVLAAHDNGVGDALTPPFPTESLIHVIVASLRTDIPSRGGEVVTHGGGPIETTGVFIYWDALDDALPQCEGSTVRPPITFAQGLSSAFVHEVGHTLQLGHDTEVGGGINYYNVMSVPMECTGARMRFHGRDNTDPSLGATEAAGSSRFSAVAAALMQFDRKLSVDTTELTDGGGVDH